MHHIKRALTLLLATGFVLFHVAIAQADETIRNPATGTPEHTIAMAFSAAIAKDYARYLDTVHPEHRDTEKQRRERERYEWSRFLKQYRWYLSSDAPVTFAITSRREEGKDSRRVFLRDQKNKERMPVPVRMKRHQGQWKIVVASL